MSAVALLVQSASAALITDVIETGGDNDANDTVVAKWTGQTWSDHADNEPVPGLTTGQPYTVGLFGDGAPAFVDRNHRYTKASDTVLIPAYLLGSEYIMSGNDNRDNATYTLDVTVSSRAQVYMLIDNRLQDGDGNTPPTFGPANMQWIVDEGWAAVTTGNNRTGDSALPDEIGIDESADGTINQWYSIYTKVFGAGTFQLKQADNAGRNMYGAVVKIGPLPPLSIGLNFGAEEVAPAGSALASTDVAGVVPQPNWNNLNGASGSAASGIVASLDGAAVPTAITVDWTSPNTWSSTGRGEENNGFPAGPDKSMMTGYIDTGADANTTATVTVSGIPPEFTSGGYDVIVYGLGGVAGRGGAYTIGGETKYGTSPASPTGHVEDAGADLTDTGTYVRFRGQFGSSFTLVASADPALGGTLVNFRAPINGIQIVKNSSPDAGLVTGYLQKVRFDAMGAGVALTDLLTNPKYINDQFDFSCLRTDFSANDANECNDCGLVVRGWFIPKASGPHIFHISADDGAGLFLSTDENPANKVQIAAEPVWTGRRNYVGGDGDGTGTGRGDPPANISAPINLVAGNKYYIEGAVKEGGGGDNLDVAVQGPGDAPVADGDRPIFGERIATKADLTGSSLAITQNPASAQIAEGNEVSFTVAAAANSPLCGGVTTYQWQRQRSSEASFTDIPGANGATYTFGPVTADDHLANYRCVVKIPGIARTSTAATLEVLGTQCLSVAGATGSGDFLHVGVLFSTFIDTAAASTIDPFSYAVSGPGGALSVTAVTINGGGKSVTLTLDPTTPQVENTDYVVEVTGVQSLVGSAMCAAPDNQATFRSFVSSGPCGGVLFETFDVNNTLGIDDLLNNQPNYPNNPRESMIISGFDSRLVYADDSHENYAGRMRGLFIPPVSGNWVFHMRSDDPGRLYFNPTGPSAAGKIQVGDQPGCCNAFPAGGGQLSQPYALEGGKGYYVELLWREFGGGDYGQVAVGLQGDPGPTTANLIGALVGVPAAPANVAGELGIAQQPASVTVLENNTATFTVGFSNPNDLPVCIQWYRDGAAIPGATKATYSFLATIADNGAKFTVQGSIMGSVAPLSAEATLSVSQDVTPPGCVAASGTMSLSNIVVQFDELISPSTAVDIFNYSVPGFAIATATLRPDGKSVLVQVDPALTPDTAYTITIQNMADLAGITQPAGGCTLNFRSYALSSGFTLKEIYQNIGGVAVTDLTGNPAYPNSPNIVRYGGLLELNTFDEFENYGARMSGWLVPPVSGAYNFFMSSDDGGALLLSTDASPANLVTIASEPVWNGRRDWNGTARRNAAAPENKSSTLFPAGIELVAGQKYYFEALVKEGGGGDNLAVAWQIPGQPAPASGSAAISGAYIQSLADPAGDSVTITQQPASQTVEEKTTATFTVAATAIDGGAPAQNVFYQWFRKNSGGDWLAIDGANSATYSPQVTLADNGSTYRASIYVPGASATSEEAGLTVYHKNTPPQFTCGPNQGVNEDAGAQSVVWATDIQYAAYTVTPILYGGDFSDLPPGSTLGGTAAVIDGVLHLTDAINSLQNSFVTPSVPSIESMVVTFKVRIGGGTCCGGTLPDGTGADRPADGMSITIGDVSVPVAFPVAAEEGAAVGNGFAVNIDTWDNNGTDEAPALDVKVGGNVLAFQSLAGVREGGRDPAGPLVNDPATGQPLGFDTGAGFADVRINLEADGTLDVDFKGVRVIDNVQLGITLPLTNVRLALGARTGGANANHWIDDLSITAYAPLGSAIDELLAAEAGQVVHFNVSNDNPSLFSVQPAIATDGTLTYTPAPNANGVASVTVTAQDDGGTANGGNDTSAPCTFTITVGAVNDCPVVAADQSVSTTCQTGVAITLGASDAEGDALTYTLGAPAHGTISGTAPNVTYTPAAGYSGPDSFTYTVSDGQCSSTAATVAITVGPCSQPPVAVISTEALVDFTPDFENPVLISCNWWNACLVLDGWSSTGTDLTYLWFDELEPVPFDGGPVTTNCYEVGTHTITLTVTDAAGLSASDSKTIEVVTAPLAIELLIEKVNESHIPRRTKRELVATLRTAQKQAGNEKIRQTQQTLDVFEKKVRAQVAPGYPEEARVWIRWSQATSEGMEKCIKPPRKVKDHYDDKKNDRDDR